MGLSKLRLELGTWSTGRRPGLLLPYPPHSRAQGTPRAKDDLTQKVKSAHAERPNTVRQPLLLLQDTDYLRN